MSKTRRKPCTEADHREIAAELFRLRDRMKDLSTKLAASHRVPAKIIDRALKVERTIHSLRCGLSDLAWKELGSSFSGGIYVPNAITPVGADRITIIEVGYPAVCDLCVDGWGEAGFELAGSGRLVRVCDECVDLFKRWGIRGVRRRMSMTVRRLNRLTDDVKDISRALGVDTAIRILEELPAP